MFSFTLMIEKLADLRAENGAEQNRLTMAGDLLALNQTNLEAAHGRIMDADIALESDQVPHDKMYWFRLQPQWLLRQTS